MKQKLIPIALIILVVALMIVPASATNGTIKIQILPVEKFVGVYLDGEYIGNTGHLHEDISPGIHELQIRHSFNYYVPITKQ